MNKLTSAGNASATINTTADKLFLLSEIEIFGSTKYSATGEGTQYAYYKVSGSSIKNVNGSAREWWERSPVHFSNAAFCSVFKTGINNFSQANYYYNVAFGFCF